MKNRFTIFIIIFLLCVSHTSYIKAEDNEIKHRMNFYHNYSLMTDIPWYIIAAIDQYERNTKNYRSYCPKEDEVISICFDPSEWSGVNNPIKEDNDPYTIGLFNGIGVDGDGDGLADRLNPFDRLTTMLKYIELYGVSDEKIQAALVDYYRTEKGVKIIYQIARLFQHFQNIHLSKRVHPIPRGYEASMVNNYGMRRSFGGLRSHEGVDIFAHYGTPVVSTAYGIIEIKGWNRLGGYRIGIRDIYNTYEFYAHLQSYAKGLKEGDIVKPGQVIGYVGSTGYGKEGTSGKFPPHLHFGFYKFDGKKEWSFSPFRYLRKWERVRLY